MSSPRVCVLRTDGTNCDEETAHAFRLAGGSPRAVHVNQLRSKSDSLMNYSILAIPGGFSYGDDIASGVVLANELISYLRDQLQAFVDAGRLILGICNGFQVLAHTGILLSRTMGETTMSLTTNDSGQFECRWVKLKLVYESPCVFTKGMAGQIIELPVAHAEGKYVVAPELHLQMHALRLAPLRYCDTEYGEYVALRHPHNPNGSADGVAGACDDTGRVLGLMPHPERFVQQTQHPNWRRKDYGRPHGLAIFQNAVDFARYEF